MRYAEQKWLLRVSFFEMEVDEKRVIELRYILHENDANGEVLEIMDAQYPLRVLFGSGALLPAFEENIQFLEEGRRFQFRLPAVDAYGLAEPSQFVQVFRDDVEEDPNFPLDVFQEGDSLLLNTNDGRQLAGRLSQITPVYLVVDCNHTMAGKDLYFDGQVLHVRPARHEELIANRYIEPNGFRF
ncbi:MAG: peptidylprolyl isomerase [Salibacteraceae bacterium]